MLSSFWFTIIEGLKGFKRARLATTITLISMILSFSLTGFFVLFSININHWLGEKQARIEFEVYFDADLTQQKSQELCNEINRIKGVAGVVFISKELAAKRFQRDFGQNIIDVLGSNPLPPSCTVRLIKEAQNSAAIHLIMSGIKELDGVNDIVFEQDVVALINHYIKIIYLIIGGAGLLLIIVSALLLFNTIRLTIFARKDIIEIMKLVGATRSFIRRPFLIEGFVQGLIGALLASGILYAVASLFKKYVYSQLLIKNEIYPILWLLGSFLGFLSAKISLSKYLKRL